MDSGKFYTSTGNLFKVNQMINGQQVNFMGWDFLFIDLDEKVEIKRDAAGKTNSLKINGKKRN